MPAHMEDVENVYDDKVPILQPVEQCSAGELASRDSIAFVRPGDVRDTPRASRESSTVPQSGSAPGTPRGSREGSTGTVFSRGEPGGRRVLGYGRIVPLRPEVSVGETSSSTRSHSAPIAKNGSLLDISLKQPAATLPKDPTNSPLFEPMDSQMDDIEEGVSSAALRSDDNGTPSPSMSKNLDGLKRARALKSQIESNVSVLKPKGNTGRRRVEDDPENHIIMELRTKHNMTWDAIATYLNDERRKRGEPATLSHPAVYSRFVRNAPRIAAALGDVNFDPQDYMHLRHPQDTPDAVADRSPAPGRPKKRARETSDGLKTVKISIRERTKLGEEGAELETAEKTELLMEAVHTVERNFWTFVADELDRMSGKLYDPKAIESRYHAI